jgi:hypothetical protein
MFLNREKYIAKFLLMICGEQQFRMKQDFLILIKYMLEKMIAD